MHVVGIGLGCWRVHQAQEEDQVRCVFVRECVYVCMYMYLYLYFSVRVYHVHVRMCMCMCVLKMYKCGGWISL